MEIEYGNLFSSYSIGEIFVFFLGVFVSFLYLCNRYKLIDMNAVTLHRSHLAEVLSSLSVADMAWAMKFLTDKLSSCVKPREMTQKVDTKTLERAKTEKFLEQICGKWEDDKDADEMVRDIYESRVNKDFSEMERIFN